MYIRNSIGRSTVLWYAGCNIFFFWTFTINNDCLCSECKKITLRCDNQCHSDWVYIGVFCEGPCQRLRQSPSLLHSHECCYCYFEQMKLIGFRRILNGKIHAEGRIRCCYPQGVSLCYLRWYAPWFCRECMCVILVYNLVRCVCFFFEDWANICMFAIYWYSKVSMFCFFGKCM